MNKLIQTFLKLNQMDETAMQDTILHRLHPLVKLFFVLVLIIFTLTTYAPLELLSFIFMLIIMSLASHISLKKLFVRGLVALPFSLCFGLSFLLFNRTPTYFYGIIVNDGVILCILLIIKTWLCVAAIYVLMATTSFNDLSTALISIKIPSIFVLVLTLTYRYIFTFVQEAIEMSQAYILRNPSLKAIEMKDMGSFVGHLLVKSYNDSQTIYQAMLLRGFDLTTTYKQPLPFLQENYFLMIFYLALFILLRSVL